MNKVIFIAVILSIVAFTVAYADPEAVAGKGVHKGGLSGLLKSIQPDLKKLTDSIVRILRKLLG